MLRNTNRVSYLHLRRKIDRYAIQEYFPRGKIQGKIDLLTLCLHLNFFHRSNGQIHTADRCSSNLYLYLIFNYDIVIIYNTTLLRSCKEISFASFLLPFRFFSFSTTFLEISMFLELSLGLEIYFLDSEEVDLWRRTWIYGDERGYFG